MSLSRDQVSALAAQLRDIPDVTTVSKQEAVRLLLTEIESMKARGLSNRRVLDVLRERGLDIGTVDTLKNYVQRAKKAVRVERRRVSPVSPKPTFAGMAPPRLEVRPPSEPAPASSALRVTGPLEVPPGHFIPVLHRVDEDV